MSARGTLIRLKLMEKAKVAIPFAFKISEVPSTAKKSIVWLMINLIGFIAYQRFVSADWPIVDPHYGVVDPLDSFMGGYPEVLILLLMFLINTSWLLVNLWKRSRPAVFVWLMVVMVWTFTLLIEAYIRPEG